MPSMRRCVLKMCGALKMVAIRAEGKGKGIGTNGGGFITAEGTWAWAENRAAELAPIIPVSRYGR